MKYDNLLRNNCEYPDSRTWKNDLEHFRGEGNSPTYVG